MTKADVQRLWAAKADAVFVTNLMTRGLAFEPEEDWIKGLSDLTKVSAPQVPQMAAALMRLVPEAPQVDAVTKAAPDLLAKLKAAAQKRSDAELAPLVHPDLLTSKARVYDLFDTTNYRDHSLGKFAPSDYRRVGVQFFQLTTSQVERLHYVLFATSRGKIVVRDVITGPAVAELFLRDEQKIALSKLQLVFRALNDGDDTALKELTTPGLFDELKGLGSLAQGQPAFSQIATTASVPLDAKSIRVVVRVAYPTRSGRKIEFDIDFERIGNESKVVRLRDAEGLVIAYDPNIDNFLNRRFGLPDGPVLERVSWTNKPWFWSLKTLTDRMQNAVEDRSVKTLQDYAGYVLEADPKSGNGLGAVASAKFISGNYDEAENDALTAIERGGTVYFMVLRHSAINRDMRPFSPAVLGISKERVQYLIPDGQAGGGQPQDISIASIKTIEMERPRIPTTKPRPFLKFEFRSDRKNDDETYNFAAFGTSCPGDTGSSSSGGLGPYNGGSVCPEPGSGPSINPRNILGGKTVPLLVPAQWERNLKVVLRSIEQARKSAAPAQNRR
jgi:hypothetical protein